MENELGKALKLSGKRYKASSLAIQVSRWRSFCRASEAFVGSDGWLSEQGLRQTLDSFEAFTTRKRMFLLFRWVVKTLAEHGYPKPDPTAALEREYLGDERPLHVVGDVETLAERMAAEALSTVSGWKGVRLAALVRLLMDTGLRKEDVRRLTLDCLALDAGRPFVRVPGMRRAPPRLLSVGPATAKALSAWVAVRPACPGNLLFVADASGRPLDPATVWRQFKRLEAAAGGLDSAVSGPTAIRAAVAERLRKEGLPVEEIQLVLGHRRRSSTEELLDRVTAAQPSADRSTSS